jgi:hypothetical protein
MSYTIYGFKNKGNNVLENSFLCIKVLGLTGYTVSKEPS